GFDRPLVLHHGWGARVVCASVGGGRDLYLHGWVLRLDESGDPFRLLTSLEFAGRESRFEAMHLQNRVTPFGDIVAIPQRGIFTGNRGIIHDPQTRTLLTKRWTNKAWLICSCEYKGRQRKVMGRQTWTELFFLDEAVALAAGHRPCFRCRREAASAFRAAWAEAKGCPQPTAVEIDAALHSERLQYGRKR